MFGVSAKKPVWFAVKRLEFEGEDEREVEREMRSENEMAEGLQSGFGLRSIEDLDIDSLDVSDIDPVKGLLLRPSPSPFFIPFFVFVQDFG